MIKEKNFLISELLDSQPDSVVWFTPIFAKGTIEVIDFECGYINKKGRNILNILDEEHLTFKLIKNNLLDKASSKEIFRQCLEVWESGRAMEFNYFSQGLNKHFNVQRSKVCNGILCITRDRTSEVIVEQEKNEQSELVNSIIENSPYGIVLYEAIRDSEGKVVDLKSKISNDKSTLYAGFSPEEVEGKTVKQILAARGNYRFYEQAVKVLESGIPLDFEFYSQYLNRWMFFNMVKFGDGILVNNLDITQRKQNEKLIEEQRNELQSILDASINAVFACEGIRDENDVVYDLILTKINKAYLRSNNTVVDVTGKRFSVLYPEAKKAGLLNSYCKVIQTGESFRTEIKFSGDGADGWFDISAVKNGTNGVVVTFTNITSQKKSFAEISEKKDLLDNILKHSPSGINISEVIRDKTGKIVDSRTILANEAAARHSGMPLSEQLSKTSVEIDSKILDSPLYQLSIKTLRTGKAFHTQYFLESTKRWLELSVAKMDNDHLICVFDDITSTKLAQLEIEKSKEKLNSIINISQAGFFMGIPVMDKKGNITDFRLTLANKVFAQFVDKEPEDLIGQLGGEWFKEYKKNGLFDIFRETYKTDTKKQFDFFYKGEEKEVWANLMITKLGDELLGSFTDFTNVKILQLQLEKLLQERE